MNYFCDHCKVQKGYELPGRVCPNTNGKHKWVPEGNYDDESELPPDFSEEESLP